MKKITLFAFAVAALSLASCKKDRTCTCTNTNTTTTSAGSNVSTDKDVEVMTKVSKGTARTNCLSTKSTSTNTFGGVSYTTVSESKCELN